MYVKSPLFGRALAGVSVALFVTIFAAACLFADDDERHTANVGNIGLIVTNYGTVGIAFAERGRLSCEYPIGSHIEHLERGGLWVGGIVNNQVRVSTGAIDFSSGGNPSGAEGFEFTTGVGVPGEVHYFPGDSISQRSLLPVSPYYDINAISHQDLVCDYTDSNTCIPQTGEAIPRHEPLGIVVHQEAYAWSQSFADAYVILDFTIRNASNHSINSPYVGYWIDTMVGNTDLTPPRGWAPNSSWNFYDDFNNYIDSLQMSYEFDYDGDYGYAESYIGMRLLGTEPAFNPDSASAGDSTLYIDRANYYQWMFRNSNDPTFYMPQNDNERYEHLSYGLNRYDTLYTNWRALANALGPRSWSMLVGAGPFPNMAPGDSIKFTIAVVCANKYGPDRMQDDTEYSKYNLFLNSRWAMISYRGEDKNGNGILDPGEDLPPYNGILDRYKLPEPPPPPVIKLVPSDSRVDVYWDNSAESFVDPVTGEPDFEGYRIYRARITQDNQSSGLKQLLNLVGQFDSVDSVDYDTGLDLIRLPLPETLDGRLYNYKFTNNDLLNGWEYAFAVSAYDRGDPANNLPSLESSALLSAGRAFPGPTPAERRKVTVFPNPYKAGSLWDGRGDDGIQERSRLIYFANLPARCTIKIYTLAGDLVDVIEHDAATYSGADIAWFGQYASGDKVFSGGIHAWDLVTKSDQALATGLYLFTVEDINSGELSRGKFVVIK